MMRTIVLYFSQTGSTRKVAEAICNSIRTLTGQCDLVKLRDANLGELVSYDLIGLGCPTFAHREPVNVARFIRRMGPSKARHCFIFSTHGGHPVNVLPGMAGKLRRQGFKVIGGFNCDGSDRYPHYTYPWFTDGHPDEIDLKAAADFGQEVVERSQRIPKGERGLLPKFQWLRSGMYLYEPLPKAIRTNRPLSRNFEFELTLDRKRCRYPACRLCVDHCPVDAIDLSAAPIVFRKGCISCYFCELLCPTGAIEVDPESVTRQRRAYMEYFHKAKYPEFFETAKTELIGNRSTLYRMLVPNVEIGNLDEFYGEAYRKRPRYLLRGRDG